MAKRYNPKTKKFEEVKPNSVKTSIKGKKRG